MPKVSVIIPTYNYGRFLSSAIESVMKQTYRDYEIIVIDDGSTDDTKEVMEKYCGTIRYIYQSNKGVSTARNKGIGIAKGQYIAFLDADDYWLPEKLDKSIKFLENNNFDWICTSRFKITENGECPERKIAARSGIYEPKSFKLSNLEIALFNPEYSIAITSTVLIRRTCFNKAGLFDTSFRIGEDIDLWLRLKEAGFNGGYLDDALTVGRGHITSLTRNGFADNLNESIKVARKHAAILKINKIFNSRLYSGFWREIAICYYLKHRKISAIKYAILSIIYFPVIAYRQKEAGTIIKKVKAHG